MRDIECPSGKVCRGCALPALRLQPGSTARQEEGTAGRGAGARGVLRQPPVPSSPLLAVGARGSKGREERGTEQGAALAKIFNPSPKKSRQQPRTSGISGQASTPPGSSPIGAVQKTASKEPKPVLVPKLCFAGGVSFLFSTSGGET